jgi:hypothetical protein
MALAAGLPSPSRAADHAEAAADTPVATAKKPATPASGPKSMADQVREAVENPPTQKRLTLVVNGKEKKYITMPAKEEPVPAEAPVKETDSGHSATPGKAAPATRAATVVNPKASRQYNEHGPT